MAKHSRLAALSDEVTWDDVRLARRKPGWRSRKILAMVLLPAALGGCFLLTKEAPVAAQTAHSNEPLRIYGPSAKINIKYATRSASLCDQLKTWSGTTVLELSERTKKFCAQKTEN